MIYKKICRRFNGIGACSLFSTFVIEFPWSKAAEVKFVLQAALIIRFLKGQKGIHILLCVN